MSTAWRVSFPPWDRLRACWRLRFRSQPELQPYSRTNWRPFRLATAGTLPPPLARGAEVFPLGGDRLSKRVLKLHLTSSWFVIPSLLQAKARSDKIIGADGPVLLGSRALARLLPRRDRPDDHFAARSSRHGHLGTVEAYV